MHRRRSFDHRSSAGVAGAPCDGHRAFGGGRQHRHDGAACRPAPHREARSKLRLVDNRPSAGGATASGQVAAAPPDRTQCFLRRLLLLTPPLQKLSFDPDKQLLPVTNVGTGAQVIAIKRELPAHTLPEFLAYAKANPGKLNFAVAERSTSVTWHQSFCLHAPASTW